MCPHIRPVTVVPSPFTQRVRHQVAGRAEYPFSGRGGAVVLRERNRPTHIHGPASTEAGPFRFQLSKVDQAEVNMLQNRML